MISNNFSSLELPLFISDISQIFIIFRQFAPNRENAFQSGQQFGSVRNMLEQCFVY